MNEREWNKLVDLVPLETRKNERNFRKVVSALTTVHREVVRMIEDRAWEAVQQDTKTRQMIMEAIWPPVWEFVLEAIKDCPELTKPVVGFVDLGKMLTAVFPAAYNVMEEACKRQGIPKICSLPYGDKGL